MGRSVLHSSGKGPVISGGRRSRRLWSNWSTGALILAGLGALGVHLGWNVIGHDLGAATHIGKGHQDDAPSAALPATAVAQAASARSLGQAALLAPPQGMLPSPLAAAASIAPQGAAGPRSRAESRTDAVARSLLAAARDHLARKVTPTSYPVDDLRANSGSHVDLLERGLADHLPIKTALVRHRARQPAAYGLAGKPPSSADERRRALTCDSVVVFLQTFAEPVDDGPAELEAGDILVLQRLRGARRLTAVVTDVADEHGNPQAVVMDPAEHAPKEVAIGRGYKVLHRFRLRSSHTDRARMILDLDAGRPVGTAL